ncbi:hypothetical protein U1Q18_011732, partial [Sarracenia purpurea var. burkii]
HLKELIILESGKTKPTQLFKTKCNGAEKVNLINRTDKSPTLRTANLEPHRDDDNWIKISDDAFSTKENDRKLSHKDRKDQCKHF